MTPIKLVATLQTLGRFTQMKTLEEITAEGPGGGGQGTPFSALEALVFQQYVITVL